MQHELILSGKTYTLPPFDMGVMVRLATMNINVLDVGSQTDALRVAVGLIGIATDSNLQEAGLILQNHLDTGGDPKPIFDVLTQYIGDSPMIKNAANANQGKGGIRWPIAKRHGRGKKRR